MFLFKHIFENKSFSSILEKLIYLMIIAGMKLYNAIYSWIYQPIFSIMMEF